MVNGVYYHQEWSLFRNLRVNQSSVRLQTNQDNLKSWVKERFLIPDQSQGCIMGVFKFKICCGLSGE